MRVRAMAIATLLMAAVGSSAATEPVPASAANCDLRSPPLEAGEDVSRTKVPMKFFPRARTIPAGYTGCQKVWTVFRDRWILFSTRYFEKGELRVFLGPVIEGQDQIQCFFTNGQRVSTSTRGCPSFKEARAPAPSLPSGCIAELQAGSPSDRCKRYE